ncbi:hypothetical protein NC652_036299 [Populus alba x Populus x berolinensis]|nr:hypothetical protein NC652_036299 [Populus alba x Populus x berolinensis]
MAGCLRDVVTYTMMIHAFNAAELWKKTCALLQEIKGVQYPTIHYCMFSADEAFNKGGDPSKHMKFGCRLRDWRITTDLIKLMEPSFSAVSIGLLNPLRHLLVKSGKIESIMKHLLDLVEESFGCWELEEYIELIELGNDRARLHHVDYGFEEWDFGVGNVFLHLCSVESSLSWVMAEPVFTISLVRRAVLLAKSFYTGYGCD